ncbi:hypothetical protein MNB_SV-15-812 [hydrothermal vent metagenome]|uniref:Lipoprotein n=1 Tax=hydrothermal vent metagenome TaxID=652676 RepID=A0A1W1EJR1_9ZZZZ
MKFTKLFVVAVAIVSMFSLASCTSYERGLVTGGIAGAVVGNAVANNSDTAPRSYKSYNYKLGMKHGCRTGNGYYTKNRYKFRNYRDYRSGWYAGRRNCR